MLQKLTRISRDTKLTTLRARRATAAPQQVRHQPAAASVDQQRELDQSKLVVGHVPDVPGPHSAHDVDDDAVDWFVELDHHER